MCFKHTWLSLTNNPEVFVVEPGMRVAQMVIAAVPKVEIIETESLDETDRGHGGFGSTGLQTP